MMSPASLLLGRPSTFVTLSQLAGHSLWVVSHWAHLPPNARLVQATLPKVELQKLILFCLASLSSMDY